MCVFLGGKVGKSWSSCFRNSWDPLKEGTLNWLNPAGVGVISARIRPPVFQWQPKASAPTFLVDRCIGRPTFRGLAQAVRVTRNPGVFSNYAPATMVAEAGSVGC